MNVLLLTILLCGDLPGVLRGGSHELDGAVGADAALPGPALPSRASPDVTIMQAARAGLPSYSIEMAQWRWNGFYKRNMALTLGVNTDTIYGGLDAWNVGIPGLSIGVFGRAELLLAGVNVAWIQDGVNRSARGFTASYAMVGGRAAYTVLRHLTVEAELAGRAWLFAKVPFVHDPAWRIPSSFVAAEPRARIKWEGVTTDRARLGLRKGLYGLIEVGVDVRALSGPWGGYVGDPYEKRNNLKSGTYPRRVLVRGFGGVNVGHVWWLQAKGEAGWGQQEDDVSRTRIGGMNPYTVNMPGTAWGEFLCERYAAAHFEAGVTPIDMLYIGLSGHLALVNDPHRVGNLDEFQLLRGLAAEARLGLLGFGVIHVRAGGTPDVIRVGGHGGFGAFAWAEMWFPR